MMIRLSMPAKIETGRLLLQRLKYEDAEEIFYAYASKPEATQYLSWATHKSVDDTRTFLKNAIENWNSGIDFSYSIRLKKLLLIGSIGILHDDGKIQIGYVISPTHWGKGYTTEACAGILSVLKTFKDLYRIGTFVDVENVASIKVLEKCGLVEEARLENWFRFINQNNQPKDCILFRWLP
jgi:ribosomal-protein-alanine N-acetyltransferase